LPAPPNRSLRPLVFLPIMISGLCAILALQMAWHDPRYLLPFLLIVALVLLPPLLARRRMRSLLISGDVKRVLGTWESSIERVMYPETMAPLMAATAYAAYGWIDAARNAMTRAVKGPAWDAALEQRLFVETLLDTFEGDRSGAIEKAAALQNMPLPETGPLARRKITLLRRGLAALARAFAHESTKADEKLLKTAATASPLIHWAMRYAAAVVAIDHGKKDDARALLAGAPSWPRESAFRSFHEELLTQL
jgi:hypothetical protein